MAFKKGQSGNPSGRIKLPQEVKEAKKLNQVELERVLNDCLTLTPSQIKKIKDDPESTMIQLLVVSVITHAVNKGDHDRSSFLLDRLLGKMKDTVEISNPYADKTIEELQAMVLKRLNESNPSK